MNYIPTTTPPSPPTGATGHGGDGAAATGDAAMTGEAAPAPPSAPPASSQASATPEANAPPAASASAAAASSSSRTVDEHLTLTIQTLEQLTSIFGFPHHVAKEAIDECGPEDVTLCYNWILDNKGGEVEDGGGPVVPRTDCPHVDGHVKFRIVDRGDGSKARMRIEDGEGNGSEAAPSTEFRRLCLEGDLFSSGCQWGCAALPKRASRKRLRSEDGFPGTGRLKDDEDYNADSASGDGKGEASASRAPSCRSDGENWLCLECGALLCSRYASGHAKLHYEDTKEEGRCAVANAKGVIAGEMDGNVDDGVENEVGESAGHCIAVSLSDLSAWCYECNAYLVHPKLEELTRHLEKLKFGEEEGEDGMEGKTADRIEEAEAVAGTGEADGEIDVNMDADNQEATEMEEEAGDAVQSEGSAFAKRKGSPRKLPPEQLGTTMPGASDDDEDGGAGGRAAREWGKPTSVSEMLRLQAMQAAQSDDNDDDSEDGSDDHSGSDHSSSSSGEDSHSAALIASLLQSERAAALRAYLSRHSSFETGDMSQCVPMHLPKPPSFPDELADFLQSPLCKSIVVLSGAGMSVSSGIPDFRSAGVGLYDTLRPELLTATEEEQELIGEDPTLALDKGMFLQNPLPMLELKRGFVLGTRDRKWRATLAHRFLGMLHSKLGKLTRVYTQNIDGLEAQVGLPAEKVVNVHGSMGAAACEVCGAPTDFDKFCDEVKANVKDITNEDPEAPEESRPIECRECGHPTVKPTIVLFRGSMPREFHVRTAEDLPGCDVLIVMGTSLTVAPANSLVYRVPPTCLRVVANDERVGRRLGIDYDEETSVRDVWMRGRTDETCLALAERMGWLDDLAEIVDELPESSARLLRERLERRQEEQKGDGDDEGDDEGEEEGK